MDMKYKEITVNINDKNLSYKDKFIKDLFFLINDTIDNFCKIRKKDKLNKISQNEDVGHLVLTTIEAYLNELRDIELESINPEFHNQFINDYDIMNLHYIAKLKFKYGLIK